MVLHFSSALYASRVTMMASRTVVNTRTTAVQGYKLGDVKLGAHAHARRNYLTPKAVTYHAQSRIINHDRSQPWAYSLVR